MKKGLSPPNRPAAIVCLLSKGRSDGSPANGAGAAGRSDGFRIEKTGDLDLASFCQKHSPILVYLICNYQMRTGGQRPCKQQEICRAPACIPAASKRRPAKHDTKKPGAVSQPGALCE